MFCVLPIALQMLVAFFCINTESLILQLRNQKSGPNSDTYLRFCFAHAANSSGFVLVDAVTVAGDSCREAAAANKGHLFS